MPPQSGELPGAIATITGGGSLFAKAVVESCFAMGVARTLVALSEANRMVDQRCCMVICLMGRKGKSKKAIQVAVTGDM